MDSRVPGWLGRLSICLWLRSSSQGPGIEPCQAPYSAWSLVLLPPPASPLACALSISLSSKYILKRKKHGASLIQTLETCLPNYQKSWILRTVSFRKRPLKKNSFKGNPNLVVDSGGSGWGGDSESIFFFKYNINIIKILYLCIFYICENGIRHCLIFFQQHNLPQLIVQ